MRGGFYLMHRGWSENAAFHDNNDRILWIWMIERASFADGSDEVNGEQVPLKRGQFSASIRYIAEAIGCHKTKVERAINRFKKHKMIETYVWTGVWTRQIVVTVCKYDEYQASVDEGVDESETPLWTKDKEINKRKKLKKESITAPNDVSEEVWKDFCSLRQAKKAPITETVLKSIRLEAAKIDWSLEAALNEMCVRGWQGFKADWVSNKGGQTVSKADQRALDMMEATAQGAAKAEKRQAMKGRHYDEFDGI